MEELDAGEEQRCDLVLAAPPRHAERIEKIVAAPVIADRRRRALQEEHRIHLGIAPRACQPGERRHLAVEPEYIGVDDVEFLAEQRQRLADAPSGFQQITLLGDDDMRRLARGEMGNDLLGPIVRIDDNRFNAGGGEPVDRMIEQGAAADADERLGHAVGDRPQPRAETGGEDHRGCRCGDRRRTHAIRRRDASDRCAGGI